MVDTANTCFLSELSFSSPILFPEPGPEGREMGWSIGMG
jgi:hypothetical protein